MFEFEVIQDLKPNDEILEIIKTYEYTVKNGKIKHLKVTNLQFIEPTEYLITYPSTLTILEYKVNEIAKILKMNENTVKTWLFRAREMLKDKLEGGFENE